MWSRARFGPGELTPARILAAATRRLSAAPHAFAWHAGLAGARAEKGRLRGFRGVHSGERCVIMANGPSLSKTDLALLKDEITFGMNRVYLLFDRIDFRPDYYVAVNELVLEQFADQIAQLEMPKFLNWNRRALFDRRDPKCHFMHVALTWHDYFSRSPADSFCGGGTVTFVALQLAYHMGFHEVVLVGLDHSFGAQGTPNRTETRHEERDSDHFHPDYFPKGSRWQLPDLLRSELAYRLALEAFEADGRKVVDATVGGKCRVFPKMPLTRALA